jgi:hypothetical protein
MALYGGDAGELTLYRGFEEERINLFGQTCTYYILSRGQNVDPLYNEPDPNWSFENYTLTAAVTYQEMDNRDPAVRDEGFIVEYDAEVFIAYNEWASAVGKGLPKEGDVLQIMNEYFDVVNAGKGGNFVDTVDQVGFKLQVKKREKFEPNRKF